MDNKVNDGIICNVKNCVYNEKGSNCNLDHVTISKGDGAQHYCKSFVPLVEDQESDKHKHENVESGQDEYFDFDDLISDITVEINEEENLNNQK